MDTTLTDEQLVHYSRHILLPHMDTEGQERLLSSCVAIVGLGGLGASAAYYLAASGVGELRLIDHDCVERSNLQRQIIHNDETVGLNKAVSAKRTLEKLNPTITIDALDQKFTETSAPALLEGVDLIVDCCDNFATRFLINASSVKYGLPLVSAAAIQMEAQISLFDPREKESPCYRCLYQEVDETPLSCSESGVLAPLVGIIGSMQALEAIKLLANIGSPLQGALLLFDALHTEWRRLTLKRDPACPTCSSRC